MFCLMGMSNWINVMFLLKCSEEVQYSTCINKLSHYLLKLLHQWWRHWEWLLLQAATCKGGITHHRSSIKKKRRRKEEKHNALNNCLWSESSRCFSSYRFSRRFRFLHRVRGCRDPECSQCRDRPRSQEDSCRPETSLVQFTDFYIIIHYWPLCSRWTCTGPGRRRGRGHRGRWGPGLFLWAHQRPR